MIDGIYKGKIKTQMGEIQVNIVLRTKENQVFGDIESFGKRAKFSGVKLTENVCKIKGEINYGIGVFVYEAEIEIVQKQLRAKVKTNKASFELVAEKVN